MPTRLETPLKRPWNAGDLAYVLFQQNMGPAGEAGLGRQVSEVLRVGWRLAGTALAHSGNVQQAMFTFVRP